MATAASPPWSDLPKELWAAIGRLLDTRIDITRFRSVCSAWHSLLSPPFSPNSPKLPLRIPFPRRSSANLSRFTVYRLHPTEGFTTPSSQGWLIKVDDQNPASVRLINPLSSLPIQYKRSSFPEVLTTLEFRMTEVCKEYVIMKDTRETSVAPRDGISGLAKVVLFPDSPYCDKKDCVVFALMKSGCLTYWRYGDDWWRGLAEEGSGYDDIVIRQGQVYVVDRLGTVYWVDPCCRAVQFSPPMCGGGKRKHLLEFRGDIYVVDRYDLEFNCCNSNCYAETVKFKVYRLDQEWGKWDEVQDLGDVVLFIGESSSFCVSVNEFSGCSGNCIYFSETRSGVMSPLTMVYVFNMRDRSIKRLISIPEHGKMFWPPPSWITTSSCLPDPHCSYQNF